MDELIQRVAAAANLDAATAQKAVGIILGFLRKESDAPETAQLIAGLPGAEEAIAENAGAAGGGLMGAVAGMMGGGGLMGLASQLSSAGLGMLEMQTVGKELFAFAREKVGEDVVGQVAASVPGLGQFA
ncbi:MAG: DUF2267 domain-containing protein [Rhizobiales bacterium]|nr:DUF2267 domain-containing protein [Hyphomicrobiales bacterium]